MIFIFSEDDLKDLYPTSTAAERRRFFRAFHSGDQGSTTKKNNMTKENMLGNYLAFRDEYKLDAPDNALARKLGDDRADWEYASTLALKMMAQKQPVPVPKQQARRKRRIQIVRPLRLQQQQKKREESLSSASTESSTSDESSCSPYVPQQCLYAHELSRDESTHLSGNPNRSLLLQILPSQMDFAAVSFETYVLLFSLYLDRKFDRTNEDQAMIVIDLQTHNDSNSKQPATIIQTIRTLMEKVHSFYPDRFQEVMVHPSPEKLVYNKGSISAVLKQLVLNKGKPLRYINAGVSSWSSSITSMNILSDSASYHKKQQQQQQQQLSGMVSRKWFQAKPKNKSIRVVHSGDGIEMSLSALDF